MVVTGLTKLKLGDIFMDMPNVTLLTSIGLVYRWGANIKLDANSTSEATNFQKYLSNDSTSPAAQAQLRWEFLENSIDWEAVSNIASKLTLPYPASLFPFLSDGGPLACSAHHHPLHFPNEWHLSNPAHSGHWMELLRL